MKKITKIIIKDFDGTLVDTGSLEKFKPIYLEKTGKIWPYDGFWGRALSLDTNLFDMPVIEDTVKSYHEEKDKDGVLMVMMTGRMAKLSNEVETVLAKHNLKFDEYVYNKGGASTLDFKIKTLNSFLEKYPDVTSIIMWEDREEHAIKFREWGNNEVLKDRLTEFTLHLVTKTNHEN